MNNNYPLYSITFDDETRFSSSDVDVIIRHIQRCPKRVSLILYGDRQLTLADLMGEPK